MRAVSDIAKYLKGNPDVTTYVEQRVYPGIAPKNVEFPYITVNHIGDGDHEFTTDGPGLVESIIQVDLWGKTLTQILSCSESVMKQLNGFRGRLANAEIKGIFLQDYMNDYKDETKTHRIMLEFAVHHDGANDIE